MKLGDIAMIYTLAKRNRKNIEEQRDEERFFVLKVSEISIVVVDYHTLPANQGIFACSSFDDELFQLLAANAAAIHLLYPQTSLDI
jgi:hypothetical protein